MKLRCCSERPQEETQESKTERLKSSIVATICSKCKQESNFHPTQNEVKFFGCYSCAAEKREDHPRCLMILLLLFQLPSEGFKGRIFAQYTTYVHVIIQVKTLERKRFAIFTADQDAFLTCKLLNFFLALGCLLWTDLPILYREFNGRGTHFPNCACHDI